MNKVKEEIQKMIKGLPLFCNVCGERLSLSGTYPGYVAWGCSYLDENGNKKPDRHVADNHYSESRRTFSFEQKDSYEMVLDYLAKILVLMEK